VASGSTTAPPPFYSRTAVVGQRRWSPEGRRDLLHRDINTMDVSGSAPSNDGLIPKLLDLLHSLSLVPELGTLLKDPINLSMVSADLVVDRARELPSKNSEHIERGFFFLNPNPSTQIQTRKIKKGNT
jgi:hypothetical protein